MTSSTTTTLRLSPELSALSRARAESLGVSLNALVAFALDAYLRGGGGGQEQQQPAMPGVSQSAPDVPKPPKLTAPPKLTEPPINRAQRRALKKRK